MSVAIILVHYRTPELLREALAAIDADLVGSGIALERIIVDNGSDPEDREAIDGLGPQVVRPNRNLGYAAGVNLGVAQSRADHLVLMNPDVLVQPKSP